MMSAAVPLPSSLKRPGGGRLRVLARELHQEEVGPLYGGAGTEADPWELGVNGGVARTASVRGWLLAAGRLGVPRDLAVCVVAWFLRRGVRYRGVVEVYHPLAVEGGAGGGYIVSRCSATRCRCLRLCPPPVGRTPVPDNVGAHRCPASPFLEDRCGHAAEVCPSPNTLRGPDE